MKEQIKIFKRRRRQSDESTQRASRKSRTILKSPVLPALLALVGGLLGTLVGQKMNATTEADKVVRAKLEEAYFDTLSLPSLAEDLHMAAIGPITVENFNFAVAQYESSNVKFRDKVSRVVAVSDLYEPKLGSITKRTVGCTHRFTSVVGDLFLLESERSGKLIVHPPSYSNPHMPLAMPEVIDMAVNVRLECQRIDEDLKEAISAAMKSHL